MGLAKINGPVAWEVPANEGRANADPPEVLIYENGRMVFKHYSTRLLALTGLNEPEILESVRSAADELESTPDTPWTQMDVEHLLKAGGMPPAPSHVQVASLSSQKILLVRAALPTATNTRKLTYPARSVRPAVSVLRYLKQAGIKVPAGTCLKVPVKLMEDGDGLVLAVLLRYSVARSLQEVDHEGLGS